eukprot:GHVO01068883.1.p1 GENE.GHVO01068883.1~~GHVO01068883.1.p1  ORF type:complete len:159 (-),score=19.60 GHVO01068883.1:264-740(-)
MHAGTLNICANDMDNLQMFKDKTISSLLDENAAKLREFDIRKFTNGDGMKMTTEVATGAIFGFCSGYATRKALGWGAIAMGVGFISVQALSYSGYIDVKWRKVGQDFAGHLDMNHDGVIDRKDFEIIKHRYMKVLTYGMPSGLAFGLGFTYGIRGKFL